MTGPIKLLVCGGRDYEDKRKLKKAMLYVIKDRECIIVHGGAKGADSLADEVANELGLKCVVYKADWNKYRKAAGPIRNQLMLDKEKPDIVLAAPGGTGTAHMLGIARKAGVKIYRIKEG